MMEPSDVRNWMIDRRSTDNNEADIILATRLRSSWGPHWRCETASSGGNSAVRELLLVGKTMHHHAIGYLANRVVFHITDLETLEALCQMMVPFLLDLQEVGPDPTKVSPERYQEMVEEERVQWRKGVDVQKKVDQEMRIIDEESMVNILLHEI
ncbi:hypothetical protein HYQ46_000602 [Verticillium longisporum]|nr:hypothetical protein HYQ44_006133 [Verticillium longisporum]KAG7150454.1 hypothetical protein HYQ46_000602 [Verticillium longisporum]